MTYWYSSEVDFYLPLSDFVLMPFIMLGCIVMIILENAFQLRHVMFYVGIYHMVVFFMLILENAIE